MAHLGEAVVSYPASGSVPSVFVRFAEQCNSASFSVFYHPGGIMLTGSLLLSANMNRRTYMVYNSSSLPLVVSFGAPALYPDVGLKTSGNTLVFPGNGTTPLPAYLGPIYGRWDGGQTLSASVAYMTDFTV